MEITVYTDGACTRNGQPGAKAGIGVYFGENDYRNYSARIGGKQTNNRAEVIAILTAARILYREILAGYEIHIYSDSTYAMRACGEYGEKLHAKNWESKKPIPNLELVKQAYETFKEHQNVKFHYIAAHTGLKDEHSKGNEGADRLANIAIGQTVCEYGSVKSRTKKAGKKIYLKLPYDEKEEGKKLGTKWDPKKKKWYIPSDMDIKNKEIILSKWG